MLFDALKHFLVVNNNRRLVWVVVRSQKRIQKFLHGARLRCNIFVNVFVQFPLSV